MRKRLAIILLAILSLAISCNGPPGPISEETPKPTPTVELAIDEIKDVANSFVSAWSKSDYDAMYALLTQESQREITRGTFEQRYRKVLEAAQVSGLQAQAASLDQVGPQGATVSFDLVINTWLFPEMGVRNRVELAREVNGPWRVAWSPSAILADLGEGMTVRLELSTPQRGNIYARDDLALAVQRTLITVGVVPAWVEDEARMLDALSSILSMPREDIRKKYASAAQATWFMPIADITPELSAANQDAFASLPGVRRQEKGARTYPEGAKASNITGYTGSISPEEIATWAASGYQADDIVGKAGIERWAESYLAGGRGGRLSIVDAQGNTVSVLGEKQPRLSQSVYLTIDAHLQAIAYEALAGKIGAVVALDPRNGEVLAMVSHPAVDANALSRGLSSQEWQSLLADPAYPLLARAAQGLYPPGSVFKIVSMAATLELGAFATSSSFFCSGSWMGLDDGLVRACWLQSGHGNITLMEGLTQSCDVVFYEIGKALDQSNPDLLPQYARGFGLGQPTGIQGVGEVAGLVPDAKWKDAHPDGVSNPFWTTQDAVNLAIGQGYLLATPLQIANMLAAVANGGTLYQPRLVQQIMSLGGGDAKLFEPEQRGQLPLTAEHLQEIQAALRRVAMSPQGTAHLAFEGIQIPVAGKTGTSESGREEPHAWFAGYAPADAPEIVVAVIVEHAGEGGVVAAPIFRKVVEAYLGLAGD